MGNESTEVKPNDAVAAPVDGVVMRYAREFDPSTRVVENCKYMAALGRIQDLKEVASAMREWIDAVPSDTELPTMPGFDRDWADEVIDA